MATPVVTIDFSASPVCGEGPLTVNFTDNSIITDGFARKWLWDFGDGSISESQNPSHIYSGDPGESYSVSLSVVATEGEFDAIASGVLDSTLNSNERIQGVDFTNNDAWAGRAPAPLTSLDVIHQVGFNGSQYSYLTNNPNINLKSASSSLAHIELEAKLNVDIQDIQGVANCLGFTGIPLPQNSWVAFGIVTGITTAAPQIATPTITPQVQLDSPPPGNNWGANVRFRTRTYTNTSTQSYGADTKPDYISLATLPLADFTAVPTVGNNPLTVQFANLTAQSDCGPEATYVWKKRLSGSGSPFVEFST